MQNEKTSTQHKTQSRFSDSGESMVSHIWQEMRSICADESMNNMRVFISTLFLIAGHMIFMLYNSGCGHNKDIHEIFSA